MKPHTAGRLSAPLHAEPAAARARTTPPRKGFIRGIKPEPCPLYKTDTATGDHSAWQAAQLVSRAQCSMLSASPTGVVGSPNAVAMNCESCPPPAPDAGPPGLTSAAAWYSAMQAPVIPCPPMQASAGAAPQ